MSTSCGCSRSSQSPRPSWPRELPPTAKTRPPSARRMACEPPTATSTMQRPAHALRRMPSWMCGLSCLKNSSSSWSLAELELQSSADSLFPKPTPSAIRPTLLAKLFALETVLPNWRAPLISLGTPERSPQSSTSVSCKLSGGTSNEAVDTTASSSLLLLEPMVKPLINWGIDVDGVMSPLGSSTAISATSPRCRRHHPPHTCRPMGGRRAAPPPGLGREAGP
mmetsp:Transcript_138376/g.442204  ORF Transcript_138376/g.442204 Transcript_138376/m.442204 type:complete len:223 (+) Transcript_138376:1982-2650(+)